MSGPNPELMKRIVVLARDVPTEILSSLCDKLDALPGDATLDSGNYLLAHGLQPNAQAAFVRLFEICDSEDVSISPGSLAWALRGATAVDDCWRDWQELEIVWTGPTTEETAFRRTDQALLDVISRSQETLLIVTFAAYKIPYIAKGLADAAERGVSIQIVVESSKEGKVTFSALKSLGQSVSSAASVYVWPEEKREKNKGGGFGAMHVKCAVADDSMLLLSSANLTEYALNLNMELGVLISGGDLPRIVNQHFSALVADDVLERIDAGTHAG